MATVTRLLENDRLPPAESEVAHGEAGDDRHAEPAVVGHEDEHDEVREYHLDGWHCKSPSTCHFCILITREIILFLALRAV